MWPFNNSYSTQLSKNYQQLTKLMQNGSDHRRKLSELIQQVDRLIIILQEVISHNDWPRTLYDARNVLLPRTFRAENSANTHTFTDDATNAAIANDSNAPAYGVDKSNFADLRCILNLLPLPDELKLCDTHAQISDVDSGDHPLVWHYILSQLKDSLTTVAPLEKDKQQPYPLFLEYEQPENHDTVVLSAFINAIEADPTIKKISIPGIVKSQSGYDNPVRNIRYVFAYLAGISNKHPQRERINKFLQSFRHDRKLMDHAIPPTAKKIGDIASDFKLRMKEPLYISLQQIFEHPDVGPTRIYLQAGLIPYIYELLVSLTHMRTYYAKLIDNICVNASKAQQQSALLMCELLLTFCQQTQELHEQLCSELRYFPKLQALYNKKTSNSEQLFISLHHAWQRLHNTMCQQLNLTAFNPAILFLESFPLHTQSTLAVESLLKVITNMDVHSLCVDQVSSFIIDAQLTGTRKAIAHIIKQFKCLDDFAKQLAGQSETTAYERVKLALASTLRPLLSLQANHKQLKHAALQAQKKLQQQVREQKNTFTAFMKTHAHLFRKFGLSDASTRSELEQAQEKIATKLAGFSELKRTWSRHLIDLQSLQGDFEEAYNREHQHLEEKAGNSSELSNNNEIIARAVIERVHYDTIETYAHLLKTLIEKICILENFRAVEKHHSQFSIAHKINYDPSVTEVLFHLRTIAAMQNIVSQSFVQQSKALTQKNGQRRVLSKQLAKAKQTQIAQLHSIAGQLRISLTDHFIFTVTRQLKEHLIGRVLMYSRSVHYCLWVFGDDDVSRYFLQRVLPLFRNYVKEKQGTGITNHEIYDFISIYSKRINYTRFIEECYAQIADYFSTSFMARLRDDLTQAENSSQAAEFYQAVTEHFERFSPFFMRFDEQVFDKLTMLMLNTAWRSRCKAISPENKEVLLSIANNSRYHNVKRFFNSNPREQLIRELTETTMTHGQFSPASYP